MVHAEAALLGAGFMFNPSQALVRKVVTRARLDELLAVAWSKRPQPIAVPNTAVYPPNFYIPALGEAASLTLVATRGVKLFGLCLDTLANQDAWDAGLVRTRGPAAVPHDRRWRALAGLAVAVVQRWPAGA